MNRAHRAERVVIIGGAIVGSFIAWSLRRAGYQGPVTVVEKDPSYQYSSTALSAASIRTQFGTPVNTRMSLVGAQLLRDIKSVFGADADVGFVERGYLVLARADQVQDRLVAVTMQREQGADVQVLEPRELRARYPGVNFDDVAMATFGAKHEGWFDAWSLLTLVRRAARSLDVHYVHGTVARITTDDRKVTGVVLVNGERIDAHQCVVAAGAWSGRLVQHMGIDLPVVPKRRTVFHVQSPFQLDNFPMLFDTSGFWVRPEGAGFIAGIQPPTRDDPDVQGDVASDFEPQHEQLESTLWPLLAARIPAMQALRLHRAWAGHYEVNTLDHNAVIGPHDELPNLLFATGFSGHGLQHAPAVGRGVAEWLTTGAYQTIDLTPLGWPRVRDKRPLVEAVVY